MTVDFDFAGVETIEFGVGRDDQEGQTFRLIAVDGDVQGALREMAFATQKEMERLAETPVQYEPSEKYGSQEYVFLPIDHELATRMREVHEANNLAMDQGALNDPTNVFCYFARLTDGHGRRLTALRRATQFKGVLKGRLIRFVTDALKMIEDNVFKLDRDFDLLIDGQHVHILRPSGFEFTSNLKDAILEAVPKNIEAVKADLKFVDFTNIQEYAATHPRAARYLASIKALQQAENINAEALKTLCRNTGVDFQEVDGKLRVEQGHILGFLEVLDRRRYELELVKGLPESYKAASRRKLGN